LNPQNVIFVDVDGTLQKAGAIDPEVVAWCQSQHAAGFELVLWSAAGEAHALKYAELSGVRPLFRHVISKPCMILDDKAWQWALYTRALTCVADDLFYTPSEAGSRA
jgi:predicted mannosyl-3-phosphoglycerate phosphatase (HAD superfamily)